MLQPFGDGQIRIQFDTFGFIQDTVLVSVIHGHQLGDLFPQAGKLLPAHPTGAASALAAGTAPMFGGVGFRGCRGFAFRPFGRGSFLGMDKRSRKHKRHGKGK